MFLLATPSGISSSGPRVDPLVWDDTASGRIGQFLVFLKPQASVGAFAASLLDHEAQGRMVMNALRQTAAASQPALRAQLDALGATYHAYWIVNALAVEGDRGVVEAMLARADVAAIESNRPFRVALEPVAASPQGAAAVEWNVSKVNAPAVWAKGFTGQGRVYANADTGVQWDHPALKSHYRGWNGMTANHNYNWWDAVHTPIVGTSSCGYNLQLPCDDYPHGTHMMGIGVGDDGAGNQIGVAPGAQWIACRNTDNGWGQPSTYLECLQFFLAPTDLTGNNPDPGRRPDAVGNSYECSPVEGCAAHSLQIAVENLRAVGVFVAASAGNAGAACETINRPPALEASAITVGATDQSDAIAIFSSRGPVTIDGSNRRKPDLVAPGVNIRSSLPPDGYASGDGTSMASPHVAGAVVLLWSAFPQLRRNIALTESVLEQTAVPLTSAQGCGEDTPTQVPNNVYGYGRLDVLAAYNYAQSMRYDLYGIFLPFVVK